MEESSSLLTQISAEGKIVSALSGLPEIVILLVDPRSGEIIDANPAAVNFYGWPLDVIQTKKLQDFNIVFSNNKANSLFHHSLADGSSRWVYLHSSPVLIKGRNLHLVLVHDITHHINTENQLSKLSEAVEQSPNIIIITDAMGNIEYANPQLTRITGYSPREVIGKNPRIFKSGRTERVLYRDLWNTILNGKIWSGAFQNRKKSGELYWESVNVSPVFNKHGVITNFVAIKTDITEAKKQEEELYTVNRTLRAIRHTNNAIFSSKNEAGFMDTVCKVIVKDCGHLIVWIGLIKNDNPATLTPTAVSVVSKEVLQTSKVSWEEVRLGKGPAASAVLTGEPAFCKDMYNDPVYRPVLFEFVKQTCSSAIALPLKTNGKIIGAISIYAKEFTTFSDDELKLLSELADDLARGISFIRMRNKLDTTDKRLRHEIQQKEQVEQLLRDSLNKEKELNKLKSSFISTTSHEFRTPLTSILSSMQLVQRFRKKWSDDKLEDLFLKVKESILNLTKLLDDILTISHADSGKIVYKPENINLYSFLEQLVTETSHLALPGHTFSFKYAAYEKEFMLDPKLVRFIVVNLLSNAYKYSPEGGKIKLRISTPENVIRISISDEGIGIPEADRKNLFAPFFRAGNIGDIGGTGLGLSIVNRAVKMHNGSIIYKSKPEAGSKFIVDIPWIKG